MTEKGLGMNQLVFFYHLRTEIPMATVRWAVWSRASSAGLVWTRLIVAGNGWVVLDLRRVVAIVVAKKVVASTVGDIVDSVVEVRHCENEGCRVMSSFLFGIRRIRKLLESPGTAAQIQSCLRQKGREKERKSRVSTKEMVACR